MGHSASRAVVALLAAMALAFPSAGPAAAVGPNPNQAVDTSLTPEQLAQQLVGAGVEVSNVTYTGGPSSAGSFDFTDPTVVGFGQGVLLSSGAAEQVVGPNTSESNSTDFALPGDPDLDVLSGFPTFDAAVLEFDFVPQANQVVFQYAFASEEYSEWVNTPYNDVFAFFVNTTNCAEVRQIAGDPASPFVPVEVNTINHGNPLYPEYQPQRPDLYRDNGFEAPPAFPIDLELDGITTVLACQSPVVPGGDNHMKLAIADASDGIYDSTVFLQASSLVSNENPVADLSVYPERGNAPLAVTAYVEGEDPNGATLSYTLDWGDGTPPATGDLPDETATETHTYAYGGEFFLTLTVTNGDLSGTSIEDVDVTGPPQDTTPPVVAPSLAPPGPFLVNEAGIQASANATDSGSGVKPDTVSCDPVDTSTPGTHTLTCRATDYAGNEGSGQVQYAVMYEVANVTPSAGTAYRPNGRVTVTFQVADANGVVSDTVAATIQPVALVTLDDPARLQDAPRYARAKNEFKAVLPLRGTVPPGAHDLHITLTGPSGEDWGQATVTISVA